MLKQHVGCAPSKEAMGYAQRAVVGLESHADVEGSVVTFVSCESFGSRMYWMLFFLTVLPRVPLKCHWDTHGRGLSFFFFKFLI
jgi:hypothetical protein